MGWCGSRHSFLCWLSGSMCPRAAATAGYPNTITLLQVLQVQKQSIELDWLGQIRSGYRRWGAGEIHHFRIGKLVFCIFPDLYIGIGIGQYHIRLNTLLHCNQFIIGNAVHFECHAEHRILALIHAQQHNVNRLHLGDCVISHLLCPNRTVVDFL